MAKVVALAAALLRGHNASDATEDESRLERWTVQHWWLEAYNAFAEHRWGIRCEVAVTFDLVHSDTELKHMSEAIRRRIGAGILHLGYC